jgi:hypothetical protein
MGPRTRLRAAGGAASREVSDRRGPRASVTLGSDSSAPNPA